MKARWLIMICALCMIACTSQKPISQSFNIKDNPAFNNLGDKGIIISYFKDSLTTFSRNGMERNDVVEIADLTQVFTAYQVHQLAQNGLLNLNDLITQYLPKEFDVPSLKNVTIQDCLSHYSGLPRTPSNLGSKQIDLNQPYEFYNESDLIDFLQDWNPAPIKKYQYSLLGYVLLGIAFEDQLVTKDQNKAVVQGYNRVGSKVKPLRSGIFYPGIGCKKTHSEMRQHLQDWCTQNDPIFSNTIKQIGATDTDMQTTIASAWHIFTISRFYSIAIHKGSSSGHSVFMAICPESKTGVVISSAKKMNLGPMGYYLLGQLNNSWKKPKRTK